MRVSTFAAIDDPRPTLHVTTWEDLLTELAPRCVWPDKFSPPLYSPAEWPPGMPRRKETVLRVHFAVLDVDKQAPGDVDAMLGALIAQGVAHAFFSTWSHGETYRTKGLVCGRLLVPLSRAVEARDWPRVWEALNAHVAQGLADTQCKDPSRAYFVPCAPPGCDNETLALVHEGQPYDVTALQTAPTITPGKRRISVDDLQNLVVTLRATRNAAKLWLRDKVKLLLQGKPLADPGERDTTLFRMACALIDAWPDADPESIAVHFKPSIAAMGPDCPDVLEKLKRHQEGVQEQAAVQANLAAEEHRRQIRAAFDFSGREEPYTPEEIESYAHDVGVSVHDFTGLWIVQKNDSAWVFVNGVYRGPFSVYGELEKAAQTYLAPASSAGVQTTRQALTGGIVPKDAKELVRDYGCLASAVHVDLTAQRSHFDHRGKVLVEAPCPLRDLPSTRSDLVDRWLRVFAGKDYDLLLDWLAVVTRLDDPCAALYVEGVKGAGKTLLAEGLARLWTTNGSTPLETAMSSWNSLTAECPLVFGDEVVPKDFRGHGRTGELRQFIQARSRTLKRKYVADSSFKGCIRLMLAANNKELLNSTEHLTANDIEAIVDRILHLEVSQEAADFLNGLDRKTRDTFVKGDVIAKHALHLRDSRNVETNHRFLVSGSKDALHRTLTTTAGVRGAVCGWLVSYLLNPLPIDRRTALLVRRYRGALLVTTKGIVDGWLEYPLNVPAPTPDRVSQALSGLSLAEKAHLTAGDKTRKYYWQVDPENLIAWAETNGYADRETIANAMRGSTRKEDG